MVAILELNKIKNKDFLLIVVVFSKKTLFFISIHTTKFKHKIVNA